MAIWVVAIGLALSSTGCGASPSASAKECGALRRTSAPVTDRGVASATGSQISIAAGSAAFTPTCVTCFLGNGWKHLDTPSGGLSGQVNELSVWETPDRRNLDLCP
jgi:hypothetical protein